MLDITFTKDPKINSGSASTSPNPGAPSATGNRSGFRRALRLHALAGVACFIIALVPLVLQAHTSGASFEIDTGDYLIDIGYSPERIDEGATTLFDFNVLDATTGVPAEYDYVWVKVQQGEDVMLATGIGKPTFGPITLLYRPVRAGEHSMHVRFQQGGAIVAEAETAFAVATDTPSQMSRGFSALLLAVGVVVGGGVMWMSMRIGRSAKNKHA